MRARAAAAPRVCGLCLDEGAETVAGSEAERALCERHNAEVVAEARALLRSLMVGRRWLVLDTGATFKVLRHSGERFEVLDGRTIRWVPEGLVLDAHRVGALREVAL